MAYNFPEGASFAYSITFAAAKTATAITNANPAAVTSTTHGYVDDDLVVASSTGWPDIDATVFKLNQTSVDAFELLGLDTTSTAIYPAGSGANSTFQKISSWVTIPQVLTISTSGGDPRFTTISPLSRRTAINVPTGFNPTTISLTLGYDATDSTIIAMLGISRALTKTAFRIGLADGSKTYGYGYMSLTEVPAMNVSQTNQVTATFSLLGKAMSYSS